MKQVEKLTQLEAISSKEHPNKDDLISVIELLDGDERAARYFFERTQSPTWAHLVKREMLNSTSDSFYSRIIVPYLINALSDNFPLFLELIQQIHSRLDEWSVNQVITASSNFTSEEAIQLGHVIHDKILELGILGRRTLPNFITHVAEQLPQDTYALDLIESLVAFNADPEFDAKQSARNDPEDTFGFRSSLNPKPCFDAYGYKEFIEKGILPLSNEYPTQIANILIEALNSMIPLRFFNDSEELKTGDDHSEVWCQRLDQESYLHLDHEEILAQACCHVCENVFKSSDGAADSLNAKLSQLSWLIFKRIRMHLYTKLTEHAQKEWIQEFIREADRNYGERNHHYEFQRMLAVACEKYGSDLFDAGELRGYLDAILAGPDEQKYIEGCKSWSGEEPPEGAFAKRQAYFHRSQLRPFASILDGDDKEYYDKLEAKAGAQGEAAFTDDDYYPMPTRGGTVHSHSPKNTTEMEAMSDEDLFNYLENWNDPQHIYSTKDEPVEITHSALSGAFKQHFLKEISKDASRNGT